MKKLEKEEIELMLKMNEDIAEDKNNNLSPKGKIKWSGYISALKDVLKLFEEEQKPKCTFPMCDNIVDTEGEMCDVCLDVIVNNSSQQFLKEKIESQKQSINSMEKLLKDSIDTE